LSTWLAGMPRERNFRSCCLAGWCIGLPPCI